MLVLTYVFQLSQLLFKLLSKPSPLGTVLETGINLSCFILTCNSSCIKMTLNLCSNSKVVKSQPRRIWNLFFWQKAFELLLIFFSKSFWDWARKLTNWANFGRKLICSDCTIHWCKRTTPCLLFLLLFGLYPTSFSQYYGAMLNIAYSLLTLVQG